jgi:hypothetical protein
MKLFFRRVPVLNDPSYQSHHLTTSAAEGSTLVTPKSPPSRARGSRARTARISPLRARRAVVRGHGGLVNDLGPCRHLAADNALPRAAHRRTAERARRLDRRGLSSACTWIASRRKPAGSSTCCARCRRTAGAWSDRRLGLLARRRLGGGRVVRDVLRDPRRGGSEQGVRRGGALDPMVALRPARRRAAARERRPARLGRARGEGRRARLRNGAGGARRAPGAREGAHAAAQPVSSWLGFDSGRAPFAVAARRSTTSGCARARHLHRPVVSDGH